MAFVTTRTKSLGQRIGEGFGQVGEAIKGAYDWNQQIKLNQAKLDEINQHKDQIAQEMQIQQTNAYDNSSKAQAGIRFQILASNDPKAAAKALYPRYAQHGKITGNSQNEEDFVNNSANLASVLGQANAQVLVDAPANIGNLDVLPNAHAQLYKQAETQLKAAEQYLAPEDFKAAKALWAEKDKEYTAHRTALEASTLKVKLSEGKGEETKIRQNMNDFFTQHKDELNAIKNNNIEQALLSGDSSQINNARLELSKNLSIISTIGKTERITEQMIDRLSLNPAYKEGLRRFIGKKLENVASSKDVEAQLAIAQLVQSERKKQLQKAIPGFAKARGGLGTTEGDFAQRLSAEHGIELGGQAAPSGPLTIGGITIHPKQ